jgi:quinol monooxygenase YgiN
VDFALAAGRAAPGGPSAICDTDAVTGPGVVALADVHGLAASRPQLHALLDELAAQSLHEPGCEAYRVLGGEDPADFVLVSTWTDEAALRSHYNTPHYQRYREAVGPLLARPSDVTVHSVSATVRPLDPGPPDPAAFD